MLHPLPSRPGASAQVPRNARLALTCPRHLAAAAWIVLSAFCSCLGWALSSLHQLNAQGYLLGFAVGLAAIVTWCYFAPSQRHCIWRLRGASWGPLRRRWRRPVPLAFLVLTALTFIGGALYAPNNWDALAYRVPRVLHWLAAGQWHWIHTQFQRLNVRGCGFEWMIAPIIALIKSDRPFFLINFISFCLLPGLCFSTLSRLGVAARAAYYWMWLLPAGYCFLLHAGSLGNDLFGAVFALASLAFGLRARQQNRLGDLWLSILAIALATGVKANNIFMALVWIAVVLPCWRLLGLRKLATAAVVLAAAFCSLLPTAALNTIYIHDWSGTAADEMRNEPGQTLARVGGNLAIVALYNLSPPLAPFAGVWNARVAPKLASANVNTAFGGVTPTNPVLKMEELPIEESAGLGLGTWALAVLSAVAARRRLKSNRVNCIADAHRYFRLWVYVATVLAVAGFVSVSFATRSEARLLNSYYPLLLLPFLASRGQGDLMRRKWWQGLAILVMLAAAIPLVLNPARPLFPLRTALRLLPSGPGHALAARAERVYSAYAQRATALQPLLDPLPPGEKVLGLVTFDDPEASLWKPFGGRRIVHVCRDDTPAQLRARGLNYIWVNMGQFSRFGSLTFDQWLTKVNGKGLQQLALSLRAGEAGIEWRLIKLTPSAD